MNRLSLSLPYCGFRRCAGSRVASVEDATKLMEMVRLEWAFVQKGSNASRRTLAATLGPDMSEQSRHLPEVTRFPFRFPQLFTNRGYNATSLPMDQHHEVSSSESVNEPLPREFVVRAI